MVEELMKTVLVLCRQALLSALDLVFDALLWLEGPGYSFEHYRPEFNGYQQR